ncbi:MAG: hypothetical protein ACRCZF_26750, partial [Gemmataceae bacterium]
LLFWSHDWSGKVRVQIDGGIAEEIDLYARMPGYQRVTLAGLRPGVHTVRLMPTGEADPRSQGTEVIFQQAVGAGHPTRHVANGLV